MQLVFLLLNGLVNRDTLSHQRIFDLAVVVLFSTILDEEEVDQPPCTGQTTSDQFEYTEDGITYHETVNTKFTNEDRDEENGVRVAHLNSLDVVELLIGHLRHSVLELEHLTFR